MINPQEALKRSLEAVETEYEDVQGAAELKDKITKKFRLAFNDPPIKEFEMLLMKNFTADEVRVALFYPQEDQIQYYPKILSASSAISPEHVLSRMYPLLLSLVFLVHRKRWTFLEEFVLNDGLSILTNLLLEENLYLRGQVMEIFLSATDCDTFDWFDPPKNSSWRPLHKKLLELSNHQGFLNNLVNNRVGSYPGGSFRALQLLAFWLSWVRALYSKDQSIQLSLRFKEQLENWCQDDTSEKPEEELKLAKTLFNDFCSSNENTSVEFSGTDLISVSGLQDSKTIIIDEKTESSNINGESNVKIKESPISSFSLSEVKVEIPTTVEEVKRLRDEGNKKFKEESWEYALNKYQEALLLLGINENIVEKEEFCSLQANIYSNTATTLWKIAKNIENNDSVNMKEKILEKLKESENACRRAVSAGEESIEVTIKTKFRLVEVLLDIERQTGNNSSKLSLEALDVANESLKSLSESIHTISKKNKNSDDKFTTMLSAFKRARAKCIASIVLKRNNGSNGDPVDIITASYCDGKGLSESGARFLMPLLSRHQVQLNDYDTVEVQQYTIAKNENMKKKINEGKELELVDKIEIEKIEKNVDISVKESTERKKAEKELAKKKELKKVKRINKVIKTALEQLKGLAKRYSKWFKSSLASGENIPSDLIEESVQCLKEMWKDDVKIKSVYNFGLEEEDLALLIVTAHFLICQKNEQDGKMTETGFKIIDQLLECSRFQTVYTMAVIEYGQLKYIVKEIVQHFEISTEAHELVTSLNALNC